MGGFCLASLREAGGGLGEIRSFPGLKIETGGTRREVGGGGVDLSLVSTARPGAPARLQAYWFITLFRKLVPVMNFIPGLSLLISSETRLVRSEKKYFLQSWSCS